MIKEKEQQSMLMQRQQLEEEWLKKSAEFQKNRESSSALSSVKPENVKLQKYPMPFKGDYKDWVRFWNQFSVEVDGSAVSKISIFNYLLELVKGKPSESILGLPHTEEGYIEASEILNNIYAKDIQFHKQLIKETESLHLITSIHKLKSILKFYNKLASKQFDLLLP